MKKPTQKEMILSHLKQYGSIDAITAFVEYGIARCAARIADLREDGHNIESGRISGISKVTGRKWTAAKYIYIG